MSRTAAGCLLLVVLLASLGCGPRYARVRLTDDRDMKVMLRSQLENGEPIPREFEQPATISSVRAAHILSAIDVRVTKGDSSERIPAFPTALLYEIGDQLSRALAKANPDQEVAIIAVRKDKRLGIFTVRYLTSLVAWVADDRLHIKLVRVEWEVPKDKKDELPEPYVNRQVQSFKVVGADGILPVGPQQVAVEWRNPRFRKPSHVRVGPGGKLIRRQVLLEEPIEEAPEGEELPSELSGNLSASTLRALADLQEQRAAGEISESVYHSRRRDILRAAAEHGP